MKLVSFYFTFVLLGVSALSASKDVEEEQHQLPSAAANVPQEEQNAGVATDAENDEEFNGPIELGSEEIFKHNVQENLENIALLQVTRCWDRLSASYMLGNVEYRYSASKLSKYAPSPEFLAMEDFLSTLPAEKMAVQEVAPPKGPLLRQRAH